MSAAKSRPRPGKLKPRGSPFQPGVSGNPAGRPKGARGKVTREAKLEATALVEDPEYRELLLGRLKAGTLPGSVECMLWYYAYGKPKETVELEAPPDPLEAIAQLPVARRLALARRAVEFLERESS